VTRLIIGLGAVLTVLLTAIALTYLGDWWDGHRAEDRREGLHRAPRPARRVREPRARAGAARAWRRVTALARRLPGAIMLPIRGDAQGREGGCAPSEPRPAARADLTGSLSPRQVPRWDLNREGPRAASAPLTRAATWAREAIGRRIQALRDWLRGEWDGLGDWDGDDTTLAVIQQLHHDDPGGFRSGEAVLDYAPGPSFWDSLSEDTITRGLTAVQ
jgi:hypothetical protein